MQKFCGILFTLVALTTSAFATVTVSSPTANSTVTSPVQYSATATSSTCSKGVASMGIYVNNQKVYVVQGATLSKSLTLSTGSQHTVVEEWDKCGGATNVTINLTVVAAAAKPTVTISAKPTSIVAGSASVLTVTAKNASTVTISGSDGSSYSLGSTGGTQSVSPKATTKYTATATGTGGTVTSSATVTVTAAPAATVSISAKPTSVVAGNSSVLTVAATHAVTVTVSGSDGSSYNLSATGGTQTVTPTSTTKYTATATNASGKATTASTTLTVTAAPAATVSISAKPTSIAAGNSSVLTVAATNAVTVAITGSDGTSYNLSTSGGTQTVSPASTTTYTATATNASGKSVTATTTLTVTSVPAATASISANPTSIVAGNSSVLTVAATNAVTVTVSGSDGSTYSFSSTGGTQSVNPTSTATYTATATNSSGKSTTASTTLTVTPAPTPTVSVMANPTTILSGGSSSLTVSATNATQVTISGSDGSNYTLSSSSGGTQSINPTDTTTYTVSAIGASKTTTAIVTVRVMPSGSLEQVNHVVFMLQENHSFDSYFGMLNPYRADNNWDVGDDGNTYTVDGIDDKLSSISNKDDEGTAYPLFKFNTTCLDDMSSDWESSFGDVNTYNFSATRPILMNGFVHDAEGYAKSCASSGKCSGAFTDLTGQRSMGYYDQGYLNYYYYMASQFALSDRWFSPVASKSIDNRIATFSGGTTQGLINDPGGNDHLSQLVMNNIFEELDKAPKTVTWKVYYTVTQGFCISDEDCPSGYSARWPASDFDTFSYSYKYLNLPTSGSCVAPTVGSSAVGDASNSFCIDPDHIAPLSQYYTDLANNTLPNFAFIEAGYANNDEHPGSAQSILGGQGQVQYIINALMNSNSWSDSIFFFAYDEGGGPYDHVPPVPGHSNDNTDASLGTIPDISTIAVNPDSYFPCVPPSGTPTTHCDLPSGWPGATSTDAAAQQGFAAQLGFRVPNFVISPFTRRHYVSHIPIDHTAVIKFVENRFIGSSANLTARDAAQPNLLDFFDFVNIPWSNPPTPPTAATPKSLGFNPCTPASM